MTSGKRRTCYEVLGVSQQAQNVEINKAFRKLALQRHPDKNPGNPYALANMQELNEAYQTLSTADGRSSYDRKLREEVNVAGSSKPDNKDSKAENEKWMESLRKAQAKAQETRLQREARERAIKEKAEAQAKAQETRLQREARDRDVREKVEEQATKEWLARMRARVERILQLKMKVCAAEAMIADLDEKDGAMGEKGNEAGDLGKLDTSLSSLNLTATNEEDEKRRQKRLQQQTSQRIKLDWLINEAKDLVQDYEKSLAQQILQRRVRARTLENELTAAMEAVALREVELREARRRKEHAEMAARTLARERIIHRREQEAQRREQQEKQKEIERLRHRTEAHSAQDMRAVERRRERNEGPRVVAKQHCDIGNDRYTAVPNLRLPSKPKISTLDNAQTPKAEVKAAYVTGLEQNIAAKLLSLSDAKSRSIFQASRGTRQPPSIQPPSRPVASHPQAIKRQPPPQPPASVGLMHKSEAVPRSTASQSSKTEWQAAPETYRNTVPTSRSQARRQPYVTTQVPKPNT